MEGLQNNFLEIKIFHFNTRSLQFHNGILNPELISKKNIKYLKKNGREILNICEIT